jgi:type II secretion system protein H
MTHRTANNSRRLGFSLIELMVVVLLIAVMSAMIIPAMHGTYEDALLRSTARRIIDVLNLANSRAVTLNQTFQVRLNTTDGKYLLEPVKKAPATASPQFTPLEGVFDKRISIIFRNSVSAPLSESEAEEEDGGPPAGQISFYPDGTADNRELLLRDRDGFQLALRINPVTARVHIVEQPRE